MPSCPLSLPNTLRNVSFLLVIAVVCIAAPFYVRRTAASRGDQTPSLPPADQTTIARNYGELALSFERNDGQTSAEARFISRGPGYDLFLTETGAVLSLQKAESPATHQQKASVASEKSLLYLKMIGASAITNIKGDEELIGKVNYFVGSDPSSWLANIPTYAKVRYTGIFPGVDLVYYGNRTQLEYDFVLAPRANLASIKFEIDGAERIKIGDEGDLHLSTKQGEVRLLKPQIYQLSETGAHELIAGSYVIKGRQIGFKVASFDSNKPLIIDPVLSYSTLLGTGNNEQGNGIAVDSQGNAYITGTTSGNNFPTTPGALQTSVQAGTQYAFVTKVDATGSNLIYSTYLSSSFGASGNAITVDAAGNAYATGYTSGADFPLMNSLRGGRNNLLITNDSGASWGASNIGTANRAIQVLAIDKNSPSTIYAGSVLNGGIFKSTDGGVTWAALNTGVTNAACPAIVIDPSASNILYAALIAPNGGSATGVYKSVDGGSTWVSSGLSGTQVSSLAIDPQNHLNIYAATTFGFSKSTNAGASWANANTGLNFGGATAIVIDPTTPATLYIAAGGGGVFKSTNSAGNWAQVNSGLTTTTVRALVMDPTAPLTLYVGTSGGGVFKTTNAGASWSAVNNGPSLSTANMSSLAIVPTSTSTVFAGTFDGRILRTTNAGASWSVIYTTTTNTGIRALAIDASSPSKVVAAVDSNGTTLTSPDAFVTKLNPAGSALLYSTLVGGLLDDEANAITIDASGNAYIAGLTTSLDYPTVNAAQGAFGGGQLCGDGFVTKLNSSGSALTFSTFLGGTGCDNAHSIALDGSGNIYIAGRTGSPNLATAGAFQTTLGDTFSFDAFVTKLTNNGAITYLTYLGGNSSDIGYAIASDASGNAYLTGVTFSGNFPVANAIQPTSGGSNIAGDAFITKLNSSGSALIYSSYLGGSNLDTGRGIAVDATGNAYVAGYTNSSEYPLVPGALRTLSPFFKSLDGGTSWTNDNYGLKGSFVGAIAVNPITPSTLFAATRTAVYKSTDTGRNWTLSNGSLSPNVTSFAVNPANPSIIYLSSDTAGAGTSFGVFKSTDGGATWSAANNGLGNVGVMYIVIDPVSPATLYAGTGFSLYKTTDSGGSWNKIGPQTFASTALVVDPLNSAILYAANGSGGKVSKSTDGGANWQAMGNGITTTDVRYIAIDPQTPATLYCAGFANGLFKTTDGGASWTSINASLSGRIVIDPITPTTLYLGTSNGIFKSTNGGSTWSALNGLRVQATPSMAINPLNSSIYVGLTFQNPDEDAFVTKISANGASLVYSTLLGGATTSGGTPGIQEAYAIALDAAGNAYVTGTTVSTDFPSSTNAYQPFNRGSMDAFVAKLTNSYIISGLVLDSNNAPVSGAQVVLNDGSSLRMLVTDTDGSYQFSGLREGVSFTVSAAKPHFTMAPTSQTFNNLSSNQTQNFVATATNAAFFSLSGQVSNNSSGLSGVLVTLSGSQQGFVTTDNNGNYSFTLAGGGNYTVTPTLLGFSFSPSNQTFGNLSADQTANFSATRQNFVVTNANDHGAGSLRQAMMDANATQGLDTITFNIPGSGVHTINLLIALPIMTEPVVIDATTQPGFSGTPLIELNGSQANSNGFQITGGNSVIRGFIINRFNSAAQAGILLTTNGGNVIQGNFIGTDSTGNAAQKNYNGILITSSSTNNLIGGTAAAARNVISGNNFSGISVNTASNQIQGNFIGTNASGSAAIPNSTGVDVTGSPQFTNNLIGGTVPGAGNLISGNGNNGINLGSGNTVQGNLIGTDASGLKAVPNGTGISATNGNTLIGGTVAEARNVISGNAGDGILVSGTGSLVQGNFIGTDITGSSVVGNGGNGVTAGTNVLIGGTTTSARNIISGNGGFGNVSLGSNSSGSSATVQGNYIGTDLTGNLALNNPRAGISIFSNSNLVGGLSPQARNIISGNTVGIQIGGSTTALVGSNVVQGNYIGLNQAGNALPNSSDGIRIDNLANSGAANNIIGGTASGAANIISFNGGSGVVVSASTGNSIRGNSIFSNGGLGIGLAPNGVNANDQGDADTGANNKQNFPVLTSLTPAANPITIGGALNSTPSTVFRIDFYANSSCDPSGNGEGAQFLDSTTVTTAGDGNATINFTLGSAQPAGTIVTATATDPAGNTSEFSPCVSGAVVAFSQSNYAVNESGGSVIITVNRSGGAALPSTVDYATSDAGASLVPCSTPGGKASAKCDFTDAFGTLRFAAGETSKTITLLISQDSFVEGPETFTISLANVSSGAVLGSPSASTITINDDVTEPPANVIDDAGNFVRQHYHDFLNREADQSGLDFWTGQITSCGNDAACTEIKRINVSAAFFLSIEFQQTGYLVERTYKVAYGDATGTSTFGGSHQLAVPSVRFNELLKDTQRIGQGVVVLAPGWEQALENNKQAYAVEFVATSRFLSAFPATMTPAQFVDKLNQNAGNVLSLSERTTAINLFSGATDSSNTAARAQAVRQVVEDQDLYNAEFNRAFVLTEFFGYLRRNPNDLPDQDYTGYDFWLTKLNQFNGNFVDAEMVKAFIASSEYRQRFGP